ncbi:hypothetical protein CNR22_01640 [Sphingobacteriaceae bacterium]|nr:hypothetical protein CNR22_01640 [Sphingobacteriaceae bacterium]
MTRQINTRKELIEKMRQLEDSQKERERYLVAELRNTVAVVSDPAPYLQELVSELAKDKDFRKDLLRIGLSAATNYLGKIIQSPKTSDALLSLLSKKMSSEDKTDGGIPNYLRTILSIFKPAKHD